MLTYTSKLILYNTEHVSEFGHNLFQSPLMKNNTNASHKTVNILYLNVK